MAVQERTPQPISGGSFIEFGPQIADRAALESAPGAGTIEFYLLTEAAHRSWAAVSASLGSGAGAVFWIGGPSGTGKTHFLNYLMALEERAGATKGRRAIVRLGLEAHAGAYDLEQRLFESLAGEIGAGDAGAMLWRRLHGGEALGVAFEQAHRVGLRAISVAIDFGQTDAAAWDEYFAELAGAAACNRQVAFNVYVAARTRAPVSAMALEVAPANGGERILAALARARRVGDEAAAAALYRGADLGGFEPGAIFPFAPQALKTLCDLAGESATVAVLARLVSAVLGAHREAYREDSREDLIEDPIDDWTHPLVPVDLMATAAFAKRAGERLGEAGRAALRIAHDAADAMEERGHAREIVDALMLERLCAGPLALSPGELYTRLPQRHDRRGVQAGSAAVAILLAALAARTSGLITFDARGAQFNPRAAGAPEVAAFNNALPLIQRFDSTLGEAAELSELRARLKRLGDAMARALEGAHRVAATLEAAHREMHAELKAEHRRTLDNFIALAGAGTGALIEQAGEPQPREQTASVIAAYEALAIAAAALPRTREMRAYLRATALAVDIAGDNEPVDKAVAAAQVECQLLLSGLDTGALRCEPRGLDALEVRFQKFKWNYIQLYQGAHERWRRENERMTIELGDARAHFGALSRLNSIAALGAPMGGGLGERIEDLGRGVVRCTGDAPITLDLVPRCPRCGFVLGTAPPASELGEVFEEVRRALKARLAALSHDAIARLIRQHDRGHRLDGFLKITQAAHTDALVRVLDDNLAHYLARLLEEVRDEAPGVIEPFARSRRDALRDGKRAERAVKQRPE
ncbi:MAG TPA: hypothetical protein VFE43_10885 [Candidatus Binataceae bacterium]|jgi:hypothetical protein|nr:hypothetical protein [Candidatus Binataceae bacterium]